MALRLTQEQAQSIIQHAISASPAEVCGLLGGQQGEVESVIPIQNIAANPQIHFDMDPRAFVRAIFDLEAQGLSLVAVYHSHPNGDPIPSPTDIEEFYYPEIDYLIVGTGSDQPQLAAWNIRDGEVNRAELSVGAGNHELSTSETLSPVQRAAVVLSLLLAVTFLIVVSLILLPPAPEIP